MKVTYPHMGYLTIPVRSMLAGLGIEAVEAPAITKRTVELGIRHSPEGVCLPYKITLGNFLESLEQGADTFVTICGAGKCRLGFYNAVQKIKLDELAGKSDIRLHTINIDSLFSDLYRFLRLAAPQAPGTAIVKSIALTIKKLQALDAIDQAKNHYGAFAGHTKRIIDIYKRGLHQFDSCRSFGEVNTVRNMIVDMMMASGEAAERHRPVPKIALIGEFYVLLEPYANYGIEDTLIRQGIEVNKFIYTGNWIYANTMLKALKIYDEEKACLKQAQPYLNHHVGGDGLKSVGKALECAKAGYAGIIHIYPFCCMPEVVAQYALKNIARDYKIPLLSLSLDEHASDVGVHTRIEAFADCIKRKEASHS